MPSTPRQAFLLREWKSRSRKKTDPHFSTSDCLSRELTAYIADCHQNRVPPRLFLTAWLDPKNNRISVGIAEEYPDPTRDRVPTLDDFFRESEEQDE